jgi:predicted transcriptional regulator
MQRSGKAQENGERYAFDRSECCGCRGAQVGSEPGVKALLDSASLRVMVKPMEVPLSPDIQAKLARIAAERGRDTQTLAQEAIERFVDYDEWFTRQVQEGIDQLDDGQFVTHVEVGARIDKMFRS